MSREFKISDFLKRIKNQIIIDDSTAYKRVTVSGNHKGVSLRDEVLGSAIGTKKQFTIKGGNFILSKIDARNRAFGIIPDELDKAIITGNFWTYSVDTNLIDTEWFLYFTHSYNFIQICIESSTGSTHRKYLDEKAFLNHKVILPEIEEQKEMVKRYRRSSEISNNLTSAINTQKQLLSKLKQSILKEAIQGKLTADWRKQNPVNEPASELLDRIISIRLQEYISLLKEAAIKGNRKPKKPRGILPQKEYSFEDDFDIPSTWQLTAIDKIGQVNVGSTPDRDNPAYWSGDINWVSSGEVANNYVNTTKEKISTTGYINTSVGLYPKGTVLMAMLGQGKTRGQTSILNIEACTNQNVAGVVISHGLVIPEYLWFLFLSRYEKSRSKAKGGNQAALNGQVIGSMPIPLPPLEEQKAIVEKVEVLMQKCQALEEEIKTSEANAQMLMQAVLKEAFEGKKEEVEV